MTRARIGRWFATCTAFATMLGAIAPRSQAQTSGGSTCTIVAPATSCSIDVAFSMQIVRVVELELSTTDVEFPLLGASDLNSGGVTVPGPGASVKSNAAWNLMLSSGSQTTWQGTGGAGANKPVADLQWSTATAGPFASLSTTAATAAQGNAGSDFWTSFYLRTKLGWQQDVPGQYTLTITYTLIAP